MKAIYNYFHSWLCGKDDATPDPTYAAPERPVVNNNPLTTTTPSLATRIETDVDIILTDAIDAVVIGAVGLEVSTMATPVTGIAVAFAVREAEKLSATSEQQAVHDFIHPVVGPIANYIAHHFEGEPSQPPLPSINLEFSGGFSFSELL